jgi:hypothetical protein
MVEAFITIVSGLPRSGTSMMMSMLRAGGMEVLTDDVREADEDNPKGYYEFELVKQVEEYKSWLPAARGKVVKMISALLNKLPSEYTYNVIFMERNIDEVLASQKKMLIRRGEPSDTVSDEEMRDLYSRHLRLIKRWLNQQSNFDVLYINYNDTLQNPQFNAEAINDFMDGALNVESMVKVIDKELYRQRR